MSALRTCILRDIYIARFTYVPNILLSIFPLIRSDNHGDLDLCRALCYSMYLLVSSTARPYRYLSMHTILHFIHEDDLPMEMDVRVCRGFIRPSSIQKV